MSRHRDSTGFTLMEMLVALTIIVAILAMVYGSFAATTRSIEASGARMASIERACFALRLMTRQIRCAYAPDTSPSSQPASSGIGSMSRADELPAHKRSALFRGDSRNPRGEVLSFITSSGLGAGPDAPRGFCRVTYRYDRLSATLSISRQDQADASEHPLNTRRSDSLLHNVTSVEMQFYDGRQWQPAWDAVQKHRLPQAIKVEIAVTDEGGRPHQFGTTIPIEQKTHPESKDARQTVAAGQL